MRRAPRTRNVAFAVAITVAGCLGGSDADNGSGGEGGAREGGGADSGASGGVGGIAGSSGAAGTAGSAEVDSGAAAGGTTSAVIIDGTLDMTFGVGGVVLSGLEGRDTFQDLTFQPSGKIVVAGALDSPAVVARYTSEGVLDPTFGNMGVTLVVVDVSEIFAAFSKIDQQSDGSLIAAGQSLAATRDLVVARFSADGELDATFGTGGLAIIDTGDNDAATELIVLPDDTLLVGAWASPAATGLDFVVVRLTADGMLDTSFGSAGFAIADFDQVDRVFGMGRDDEGRIVVGGEVGSHLDADNTNLAFARFTPAGVLDASFGDQGRVVLVTPEASDYRLNALAVLGAGEIIATGTFDDEPGLIRLTSAGELDASFGESGLARAGLAGGASALIREASSTLIVGYGETLALIARFTDAGELDPSFDDDGIRTFDLGTGDNDRFFDVARQPDGKLVAVGWAPGTGTTMLPPLDGALVRLDVR